MDVFSLRDQVICDYGRYPEVPRMTAGRAALVALMHRYLGGLLDPSVTLLEIHKLMYFAQEAGEPLRLRFRKAAYGPYAENLRHVLHTIEAHMTVGYADGGDRPDKEIRIVPGAHEEAERFLAADAYRSTRERLDRVAHLIEGFESPFGLELLSSVHWLQRHEALPRERLVEAMHTWNDRKRVFTPRQIGIAANRLQEQRWLDPSTPSDSGDATRRARSGAPSKPPNPT